LTDLRKIFIILQMSEQISDIKNLYRPLLLKRPRTDQEKEGVVKIEVPRSDAHGERRWHTVDHDDQLKRSNSPRND